jgi:hypothetical protein
MRENNYNRLSVCGQFKTTQTQFVRLAQDRKLLRIKRIGNGVMKVTK